MNAGQDPEFDAFLADVTGSVDGDLADDAGFPDFAAVVAMAHELDPTRVSDQAVAEVADYAPVVPLAAQRRRRSTRDDVAMAAFVAEVRAAVDVDVAEAFAVRAAGAPPVAGQTPRQTPGQTPGQVPASTASATAPVQGPRTRRVWGAVLAAAAAVLLVGGGVVTAVQLSPGQDSERGQAALHEEQAQRSQGEAEVHDGAKARPRPAVSPEPEPKPVVEETPVDLDLTEEPVAAKRPRKAPRPSLTELDAAARQAWRDGDRDEAKRLFTQIIARGRKGKLAELAYGDLMEIARQQRSRGAEAKLWRGYLKRFPHGLYADDSRAGLCRRANADKAVGCWTRYLGAFPNGSHAAAAKDALAAAESSAP